MKRHLRRGRAAKQQRQKTAQERAEARATRTPQQQLAKLEKEGHAHCKEAKRLRAGVSSRAHA